MSAKGARRMAAVAAEEDQIVAAHPRAVRSRPTADEIFSIVSIFFFYFANFFVARATWHIVS